MSKYFKAILFISAIFLICHTAIAGGLSTTLTETKIKDAEPGKIYSIKEETGKPLIVKNTTETRNVDITIEAEKPVDYKYLQARTKYKAFV